MTINIRRSSGPGAPRIAIFGPGGGGKTTLALGAPDVVLLSGEGGHGRVPGARPEVVTFGDREVPQTWKEVKAAIEHLASMSSFPGKTFVLDGFSRIEDLCADYVIEECKDDRGKSIRSLDAAWGAGSAVLLTEMREILAMIERVWCKGVTIVFVCGEKKERHKDANGDVERMCMALNTHSKGCVEEQYFRWCDYVGHLDIDMKPVGERQEGDRKVPIFAPTGGRTLYLGVHTDSRARHVKARRGPDNKIVMPEPPLSSWDALSKQIERGPGILDRFEVAMLRVSGKDLELARKVYNSGLAAMANALGEEW